MPYPLLNEHSESQYLELEKNFLNLFNFVLSLQTITEGEDLNSDTLKIQHFGALCIRISQAIEEYMDFAQQVRKHQFKGDSTTTNSESAEIFIKCNKQEHKDIIEGLEHFANSYPDLKVADRFKVLANDIKNIKQGG